MSKYYGRTIQFLKKKKTITIAYLKNKKKNNNNNTDNTDKLACIFIVVYAFLVIKTIVFQAIDVQSSQ